MPEHVMVVLQVELELVEVPRPDTDDGVAQRAGHTTSRRLRGHSIKTPLTSLAKNWQMDIKNQRQSDQTEIFLADDC